ncbi:Glycerophosphoryl diester phosphodiesterase family-domain-containing protein [Scheffersomyces xylosifermentans]|uniref:Glycerophosphoryl diester phosphodiesterase family-domain-containing protein n=1 Tax=Scheffersomyces xylosifermentans TaxID=1304137 RepID=UPI00315DC6E6
MKFGKTYLSHQIPEWSIYYMNYKHLKKVIKNIDQVFEQFHDQNAEKAEVVTLIGQVMSSFFYELDRDIERVNDFYNTKYVEYSRRLVKIKQVLGYQDGIISHQIESNEELEEIISILLEERSVIRNLKWFGELNHKGFIKILKKLDKKLTWLIKENLTDDLKEAKEFSFEISNHNKEAYLSTRVNALPFANETELLTSLDTVNHILNELGESEALDNEQEDDENIRSYYALIENDDAKALEEQLKSTGPDSKTSHKSLISLLNKAASFNSTHCIDSLLEFLEKFVMDKPEHSDDFLYDQSDISGRNFFHQHIISLGKKQFIKEQKVTPGETAESNRFLNQQKGPDHDVTDSINGLSYILKKLHASNAENAKKLLMAKDNYNRTPLHYSAQYGLKIATNLLLDYMTNWELIDTSISIDNTEVWGDQEGLTPLHLSIIGKHPKTTENLIIFNSANSLTCPNLILLAVRLNSSQILDSLINQGKIDINYTDSEHHNETALYIAAKLNYVDLVEFLLKSGADTEIGESVFGWTPIFIAASDGFEEVVKLLIDYKCKYEIVDDSGWLPMEHAYLRGHLKVGDLVHPKDEKLLLFDMYHPENNLSRVVASPVSTPLLKSTTDDSVLSTSSIDRLPESSRQDMSQVYKQLRNTGSSSSITKPPKHKRKLKPIKSFGHRYLNEDESLIMITLGTTDLRDNNDPIELNQMSLAKSFSTELDTALSLSITCRNKSTNKPIEPPVIIDLPLEDHHGSATDPLTFKLSKHLSADDVIISFDLIPTYQIADNKKDKILGRAIALLKDAYTKVGPQMRSLNNSITIPILESSNLDILGLVRFEYLCVKPFTHKSMTIGRTDTYWKQLVSTRVIGHRGLGKNVSGRNSLQLGENTVESFIAAASLGASYVEFDVQLTKDSIPVVYHDFTVAESGIDIPMHSITAEQFLGLNDVNSSHDGDKKQYSQDDEVLSIRRRAKSSQQLSNISKPKDDELDREFKDQISRRMKLTKTWKDKGFKGNFRGMSVASNFVTLKELFKKLPKNVGFNMELKYPMLDEAEQESMGEIAIDMNHYVDTILKVIYDENASGRDILFSSFHPDICVYLSMKQPTIPILFLTEAGTTTMSDIRASSLQNAIRFSKKWNLLGIVSAAETIVKAPRLTQVVKSSGLVCVTYGVENNDPELAKIQMRAGVDAVIADSVLAVREGLRQDKDLDDSSASD